MKHTYALSSSSGQSFECASKYCRILNCILQCQKTLMLLLLVFLTACVSLETLNEQRKEMTYYPGNRTFEAIETPYQFKEIYVFGDSLSDTGNFFSILDIVAGKGKIRLVSPPAFSDGARFTNYQVMLEYIAQNYNLQLRPAWDVSKLISQRGLLAPIFAMSALKTPEEKVHQQAVKKAFSLSGDSEDVAIKGNNFAVAGAYIADTYQEGISPFMSRFNLQNQIDLYMRKPATTLSSDTLYVVFIGGNDIINITFEEDSQAKRKQKIKAVVATLSKQVSRLQKTGGTVWVISPGNISMAPIFANCPPKQAQADELSKLFEEQFFTTFSSKESIFTMNLGDVQRELLATWERNYTDACVKTTRLNPMFYNFNSNCSLEKLDSGSFFFFDSVHTSDEANRRAATIILKSLGEN